jgi:hypothetical protein
MALRAGLKSRPTSCGENSCIRFSLSWELSAADSIHCDMVRPVLCWRTALLRPSCSGNCDTLTRESLWKFTALSSAMGSAASFRTALQGS